MVKRWLTALAAFFFLEAVVVVEEVGARAGFCFGASDGWPVVDVVVEGAAAGLDLAAFGWAGAAAVAALACAGLGSVLAAAALPALADLP